MAKYAKLANRKTFNGKVYNIYSTFWEKQLADKDAKRLRKQGYLVRITKISATESHNLYAI